MKPYYCISTVVYQYYITAAAASASPLISIIYLPCNSLPNNLLMITKRTVILWFQTICIRNNSISLQVSKMFGQHFYINCYQLDYGTMDRWLSPFWSPSLCIQIPPYCNNSLIESPNVNNLQIFYSRHPFILILTSFQWSPSPPKPTMK